MIRQQIGSALDIIVHLGRMRDHSRKTLMITEVLGVDPATGMIRLNPLYQFQEDRERSTLRHVEGSLVRTANPMQNTLKLEMAGFSADV